MTTIAVIPARYGSTRFPGKPLADQTGKYLIQHVCERVCESRRVEHVIVATDDDRIVQAVKSFGGDVRLTRSDHPTGTDGVVEVTSGLDLAGDDLVLNVQGDEPEIDPDALDRLVERMDTESGSWRIGTLAAPFHDDGPSEGPESPLDPNCVKVVLDDGGRAMYFSRSPIPYPRRTDGAIDKPSQWLLHLGVYAFRADTLRGLTDGNPRRTPLQEAESLEQLGWLERGLPVGVVVVKNAFAGIDTPEDYEAFVRRTLAG